MRKRVLAVFKSLNTNGDSDRDETRAGSIRSRRRELHGRDEGMLFDPTRRMGELDCSFGPTRPFGELDDLLDPTPPFGELDGCVSSKGEGFGSRSLCRVTVFMEVVWLVGLCHGLGGGFGVDCWCWSFRLVYVVFWQEHLLSLPRSCVFLVGLLALQWFRPSVLPLRGGGHFSVGRWLSLGCEGPRVRIGGLGRRFPSQSSSFCLCSLLCCNYLGRLESGGVLGVHSPLCSSVVLLELLSFSSVGDVQMV
ncbi:hypothetical protein DY000_02055505 [Brassica cretica]|uniref:Uncharacterized protein n=1 Tax=Brassica cretica TaxID=69181 RepID=A0ABQ7A7L8_BRACR|nr:hypothetical protein DY000_02055505 [Brassica cretica]